MKSIKGKNHTYGVYDNMDDAVFARNLFADNDWDLEKISDTKVYQIGEKFAVGLVIDGKLRFLAKYPTYDEAFENIENEYKKFIKNPYKSTYGTYIYKRLKFFDIQRKINGKNTTFAIVADLDDATFIRDLLVENDWDLNKIESLPQVQYSEIHNKYLIIKVIENRVVILEKFDDYDDACANVEESFIRYKKSHNKTGEKNIVFNGKLFAVHKHIDSNLVYFGSFRNLEDACLVRDVLKDVGWDMAKLDADEIYQRNNFYYRLVVFEKFVKIIGKYESYDDAVNDENNLSEISLSDLEDENNQYAHVNRFIHHRNGKFWILKRINGELRDFGHFETRKEAIEVRDELESNKWVILEDADSLFSDGFVEDDFSQIISGLTMWQKLIFDTIDRLNKTEFTFDELVNHSFLKPYKRGKFEEKILKYLNEIIDLGLVLKVSDECYQKLWGQ